MSNNGYSSSKPYDMGSGNENDRIAERIVQETCKIFYPLWVAKGSDEDKYKIDMYLYATPEDRKNRENPLCGLELDRAIRETWTKGDGYYKQVRNLFARKRRLLYNTPMRAYHLQLNDRVDEYGRDGFIVPYVVIVQNQVNHNSLKNNDNNKEGLYAVPREQLVFGLDRFENYILADALDIYNTACSAVGGVQLTIDEIVKNRNLMKRVFSAVNRLNNSVLRRDHLTKQVNHCPTGVYEDEKYVIKPENRINLKLED